ncbi:MAG: segregation/condensation protein A [Thermoplasmatota archaeon]
MATAVNEPEVLRHLLYHRSAAEGDASARMDQYVELLRTRKEGDHVAIEDPFNRAIALAFELVLECGLDPWDIDLVKFSSLYLERVRRTPEIDLVTAGRILVMAWTILRLQSDNLRAKSEPPAPIEEEPWDAPPDMSFLIEDPDFVYTQSVVEAQQAPIDEKVRHKGDRKVTLMELIEALEAARKEAEMRAEWAFLRDAEREKRKVAREGAVEGHFHKEDQEREVAEIWERIVQLNGHPIPLDDVHGRSRADLVKALVSVLFLARSNKVVLWQEDFPYGTIFIQNASKIHAPSDGPGSPPEARDEGAPIPAPPSAPPASPKGQDATPPTTTLPAEGESA